VGMQKAVLLLGVIASNAKQSLIIRLPRFKVPRNDLIANSYKARF